MDIYCGTPGRSERRGSGVWYKFSCDFAWAGNLEDISFKADKYKLRRRVYMPAVIKGEIQFECYSGYKYPEKPEAIIFIRKKISKK